MAESDALYLVDGSGFVFRAFHALPPLTTKAGTPTGAVYGFAQMLIKLEQEFRPSHLAVVFDAPGKSFRDDVYEEYKANRPPPPPELAPQFPLVRRVTDAFGVRRIEMGGVEADDVIATLTRVARERGLRVVIVSSDKDLMQLVSDGVVLHDTMKTVTYGPKEVEEKFGVGPDKLGDVLALMGDSVDNVPGVPGVGPKTAAELVRHFGSLDALLARTAEVAKIPKLRGAERVMRLVEEHAEDARLSRRLVALDASVPLDFELDALRRHEPEMPKVEALLRELEFERLIGRLKPVEGGTGSGSGSATATGTGTGTATIDLSRATEIVLTVEELAQKAGSLAANGEIGLVLEPAGPGPWDPLAGIAVAAEGRAPIYVPVGHRYLGAPAQPAAADALAALAPLLADGRVKKHIHFHKGAHLVAARHDARIEGVAGDPELAAYLLDPAQPSDLASLAARFGAVVEERGALWGEDKIRKKRQAFDEVPIEAAAAWAGKRAAAALAVSKRLAVEVARAGMGKLLDEVELPLGRVLATIERHGVKIDVEQLERLGRETEERLEALEREVAAMAGVEINLGSPRQLAELLFDKLQLPPSKKTKTGYSTDAEVLEELAPLHPIAAKIHEHRQIAKLKGTYIDTLPGLIDQRTGRLHTSYDQTVAATGRLSSRDPNLQNIPIRSELGRAIRRAFVADKGCRLIAADYSQIELRVLAHLSGDRVLTDAFERGQDVHQRTACEMFRVAPEAVTSEMRRIAKAINFGIIYGQTDFGLARAVGIGRDEARRYIADYFARYAGVSSYMERLIAEAHREAGARTLLGRFRPLPDLASKNRNARLYAERMARNTPIQGTAADLIKLAMISVEELLEKQAPAAKMLLTVHDELVLEAPEGDAEKIGRMVQGVMEGVWKLNVPLVVDIGVGENWAEC